MARKRTQPPMNSSQSKENSAPAKRSRTNENTIVGTTELIPDVGQEKRKRQPTEKQRLIIGNVILLCFILSTT